jgi:hypothetical protein
MTRSEILDKVSLATCDHTDFDGIYKAMDEYAKQQSAAFLVWHTNKMDEYSAILNSKYAISIKTWDEMNKFEQATNEGRYEMFIEQQSKEQ